MRTCTIVAIAIAILAATPAHAVLQTAGLVGTRAVRAKVVLKGEIKRAVKLKGVAATAGAKAAIVAAGGSVE